MRQIADDFERAGIPIQLSEDLLLARWQKLVWNIPYNGLSVVLDARTDELMADSYARSLVEQLMSEVVAGAAATGRIIGDRIIQQMLNHTEKMTPYRTSMKVDYDEKRPLEIEAIFGNPLRTATAVGVDLPLISILYRQLTF
jgi:2-dehydropantoate 2-reductase